MLFFNCWQSYGIIIVAGNIFFNYLKGGNYV
jgi:hypothetical protein